MADSTDPISQDQFKTLSEKVSILQKTIDRLYEDHGEWQDENNNKLNEIRERVGKLENIHNDIVDTFKDIGFKFNAQKKEITNAVEDTIHTEIEPMKQKVNNLVKNKPKVLHYIQGTKSKKHFWQFWRKS